MTFGQRLKALRLQAGLSQEEVGRRLSVHQSTIAGWETGKRTPDIDQAKEIAAAVGTSPAAFFVEDEELDLVQSVLKYLRDQRGKTPSEESHSLAAPERFGRQSDLLFPLLSPVGRELVALPG